jgi:carotenoid cleavage dioxygenase-like enzyme
MTPVPDHAPLLEKCFQFDAVERDTGLSVWGELPEWLRGSYYMIAPARFEPGARWTDGDGMVSRLEFTEDGVEFTSRFVASQPASNAGIHWYAGRLLAFADRALPTELNPVSLQTIGPYDFNGAIDYAARFSCRPKIDRHLVNFAVPDDAEPALQVYEFDGSGNLLRRVDHPLGGPAHVRDFGLSNRRMAFFSGARILVAPRFEADEESFWVESGQGLCLSVINAFDDEDQLILDVLESADPLDQDLGSAPDLFTRASASHAVRYVIDCKAKDLQRMEMEYDHISRFPAIEPANQGQLYSDFWFLGIKDSARGGRKFFDELAHGHWTRGYINDIFEAPRGEYLSGTPVFVRNPNKKKKDSVLIVQHLIPAREKSGFMIFDPLEVRNGPVARVSLKHRLHPGFHAIFVPE